MNHPRIIIETIDFDKTRIKGHVGDWFYDQHGDLRITVVASDILPNVQGTIFSSEIFLIALHELIEARLCMSDGIDQEDVDAFDAAWRGETEPGDDGNAPYRRQHRRACLVEFMMAEWLGIDGYGEMR